jgi:proline dehydrogenase
VAVLHPDTVSMSELNFNNTSDAFAYKADGELKKARFLFSMMGNRLMLRLGLKLIPLLMKLRLPLVRGLVKNTIFKQFVGGETLEDTIPLIEKFSSFGVETVIDYGVEGKTEGDEVFDAAARQFIDLIRKAAAGRKFSCISIKATAFMRMELMEKVDGLMASGDGLLTDTYHQALELLEPEEKKEWGLAALRFMEICREGAKNNIGVWIDAEETWLQHPVDALSMLMMEECNKQSAVLFNTIQLYRHDRLEFLKECHRYSSHRGFVLGVKLVRGAYMEKERKRARDKGYSSPIQPDKNASDRDYDLAVAYCIRHIEDIAVVVASHNEESCRKAAEEMHRKGMMPDDKRVFFSQLMGMSDNITFNLAARGFRAQKYVPFGPIEDVIPYLMRRAEENSSVKGQTGRELTLINKEISRRKK